MDSESAWVSWGDWSALDRAVDASLDRLVQDRLGMSSPGLCLGILVKVDLSSQAASLCDDSLR